jgi:hypothetical protein
MADNNSTQSGSPESDDFEELKALPKEELMSWAEWKIDETLFDICNYDEVAGEMAMTNALGWGVDVFDVLDVEIGDNEIRAKVEYQLCGDQEDEKPWHGTEISGTATAVISPDGTVDYRNITAERDLGESDFDPDLTDEDIYRDDSLKPSLITDPIQEIKRYLAKHPEKIYNLNPRRFEELIAAILKDFGFDTELTPATRDGGRDIYAYVRNAVTSFLMFVECKRWASHRKVGIDVVQRVHGAAKAGGANKAMIVTSSFFTLPAQEERRRIEKELDLADYDKLKSWLRDLPPSRLMSGEITD